MSTSVKAEITQINIPTYPLGEPEINPVFFEKRVYQGSSGKVYPVPFIDKVFDEKINQTYEAAILENDFVKLVMLPEIGGRIFEAQDKTNNNYNFFYQQKVIKPALVGLAGPWLSGGVEFNWPQHHRPGTYLPTDTHIEVEPDGAKTIWMSEYDPMNRLKGMHGIRLRPNSALIELRGRLYNTTPLTQTFLWWANVAVEVHDNYQSFFPPDVHYVADHAVRAMSSFPEANNDYYGIDYNNRKGHNDLRKYQNIPVPTSYMVCDTKYDFFGGYDFNAQGGFVHVANRHIAPGKKQWTWGSEAFGKAWDRELTDEGGPYFELMAGVYTDNQPDFTYLQPYETKTFSQFWWSYKNIGPVQNANTDLAIRLEILNDNILDLGVASSKAFKNLSIILKVENSETRFINIDISPNKPWINKQETINIGQENTVSLIVKNDNNEELIAYHHRKVNLDRNRKEATEPKQPEAVQSVNELELIAEHLELYRHPTRYPEPYWEEAIRRDPNAYKSYIGLGKTALKNGDFITAENHLKQATAILTSYHPNPQTGEAHYFCALACQFLGKENDAYALFYKATWNFEWRAAAYYHLATLDCKKSDFTSALKHLEHALDTNRQNNKVYVLKATIQNKLGLKTEAEQTLKSLLNYDALDQWALFENANLTNNFDAFLKSSRNDAQTIIDIAFNYIEAGFYANAIKLLEWHHVHPVLKSAVPNPMEHSVLTKFILAWAHWLNGYKSTSKAILHQTKNASFDYVFPSRIYEQIVLEWALNQDPKNTVAAYGLGNYFFNLKQHDKAILAWETAANANCNYGTLYRNLGIAYWNAQNNGRKAKDAFLQAIDFAPNDTRIRYEYDQLRKKLNDNPKDRLQDLEKIIKQVTTRDDFCVELAALYNFEGQYQKALDLLENRNFHPWEGGEGQVLKQFTHANLMLGQEALNHGDAQKALQFFERSINTPDNLGEKYHPLQAIAHINYWIGKSQKTLGNLEQAENYFRESVNENGDFIDMAVSNFSELSYYKALSLQELGKVEEAHSLLLQIKAFAEQKLNTEAKIDYFATSLPLLLVFNDDLQKRNTVDAKYLLFLAAIGLKDFDNAKHLAAEILELNTIHVGVKNLLKTIETKYIKP
ncbi:DUF5107 domain-containing protein [Neotamlana nanhaiensis]|uniref:DUF5107 domain-containing protein n=1 Tax=Neotamlana nanhaiensis TaxID=1382798 RepID=UPI0005CC3FA9|nr:DUF5107 domain-containing protein [Tamlana nanhaiensis]